MSLEIIEEPIAGAVAEYARVPIAFEVRSVFDVSDDGRLVERAIERPFIKDFGEGPTEWRAQFDLSSWGLLSAQVNGRRAGGAVIAFDTPGVEMLEGRRDLAVLWDIRVAPDLRGRGIGPQLFRAVEKWAIARNCRELKIETQNVNVAACRFYERQGCRLRHVNPSAYPEHPDEIQLLWYKDLS